MAMDFVGSWGDDLAGDGANRNISRGKDNKVVDHGGPLSAGSGDYHLKKSYPNEKSDSKNDYVASKSKSSWKSDYDTNAPHARTLSARDHHASADENSSSDTRRHRNYGSYPGKNTRPPNAWHSSHNDSPQVSTEGNFASGPRDRERSYNTVGHKPYYKNSRYPPPSNLDGPKSPDRNYDSSRPASDYPVSSSARPSTPPPYSGGYRGGHKYGGSDRNASFAGRDSSKPPAFSRDHERSSSGWRPYGPSKHFKYDDSDANQAEDARFRSRDGPQPYYRDQPARRPYDADAPSHWKQNNRGPHRHDSVPPPPPSPPSKPNYDDTEPRGYARPHYRGRPSHFHDSGSRYPPKDNADYPIKSYSKPHEEYYDRKQDRREPSTGGYQSSRPTDSSYQPRDYRPKNYNSTTPTDDNISGPRYPVKRPYASYSEDDDNNTGGRYRGRGGGSYQGGSHYRGRSDYQSSQSSNGYAPRGRGGYHSYSRGSFRDNKHGDSERQDRYSSYAPRGYSDSSYNPRSRPYDRDRRNNYNNNDNSFGGNSDYNKPSDSQADNANSTELLGTWADYEDKEASNAAGSSEVATDATKREGEKKGVATASDDNERDRMSQSTEKDQDTATSAQRSGSRKVSTESSKVKRVDAVVHNYSDRSSSPPAVYTDDKAETPTVAPLDGNLMMSEASADQKHSQERPPSRAGEKSDTDTTSQKSETASSSRQEDSAQDKKSDDTLPPNWKAVISSNGRLYYFHVMTGRSQWELPTAEPLSAQDSTPE